MKLNFIIVLVIYLILVINCKKDKKRKKKKQIKENEDNKLKAEEEGSIMSDKEFEEKLQQILVEKNITKAQNITKEILNQIFDIIYDKDFRLDDLPNDEDSDTKLDSKQFLNEIFKRLSRGLDYDDEIKVTNIKEWISPKRVKGAVNEIVENLIGMMDNIGKASNINNTENTDL